MKITITTTQNGFLIEKHTPVPDTCACDVTQYIASNSDEVKEIVYKLLPAG